MSDKLLGAYTKQAASERATIQLLINAPGQPLNKLEGIVYMIGMFQESNPAAVQFTLPGSGIKVPQEVIDQLTNRWEYTCTHSATVAPAGMPFVTTWRLLTAVSWGAGDADREKVKQNNTSRTTLAVVASDPELFLLLRANASYRVSGHIVYSANTSGAFKYRLGGPSATFAHILCKHTAANLSSLIINPVNALNAAALGVASAQSGNGQVEFQGVIHNGASPGLFSLDWSQNTSTGNATTVYKGSWIRAIEI